MTRAEIKITMLGGAIHRGQASVAHGHPKFPAARADFLRELAESPPDIILADYALPQFGALQALELLQQLHSEVPLILVTVTVASVPAGIAFIRIIRGATPLEASQ